LSTYCVKGILSDDEASQLTTGLLHLRCRVQKTRKKGRSKTIYVVKLRRTNLSEKIRTLSVQRISPEDRKRVPKRVTEEQL
jgi:hypothetical protein